MILLREAQDRDVEALEKLAQIPGMFNLPDDRDLLKERILKSKASFAGKVKTKSDSKYTFIAEDLTSKKILATSMIAGQHGTPESPHFYFEIGNEKKFSETINTGFIHGTLTLGMDTQGPSEIGALVVDPETRNTEARVGRQISFVRFLYAALYPEKFQSQIIAELLPPLNKRGLSPLWEAVGRRFTNMDYWEADQLCAKNKDFIFDLFPSGKIYTTFLSAEARNSLGKVGKDTQPVMHMLQKIGFKYKNQVDPFDGGPHLWAQLNEIKPIQNSKKLIWKRTLPQDTKTDTQPGLMTRVAPSSSEFRAIHLEAQVSGQFLTTTQPEFASEIESNLKISEGDSVLFMPYY
jgi:arginine N-succinyltransferase